MDQPSTSQAAHDDDLRKSPLSADVSRKRRAVVCEVSPDSPLPKRRKVNSCHAMIRDQSEDYDYKLTEWLPLISAKISPLSTFYCHHTGDSCELVNIFYKKQIRSLVGMLFDLKRQGCCLSRTAFSDLSDLYVREDIIKFPKTAVVEYTSLGFTGNFHCLASFIMTTFFKMLKQHDLPVEFRSFMALLQSPDRKREILLRNHICLMTVSSVGSLITAMHKVKYQMASEEFNDYLDALEYSTLVNTWMKRLKRVNDRGLFQRCFDDSTYKGAATDTTRFFRNCLEHLLKYSRRKIILHRRKGYRSNQRPFFKIHEVPMILFARYGDMITRVFEDLHTFGLLHLLEPENFF